MEISDSAEAKQHEIQHLLLALDQLGKNFGLNRDTYYTLGRYLGYTNTSLLKIESQKDPLSWILCSTCVKHLLLRLPEFFLYFKTIVYSIWSLGRFQTFHYT